MLSDEDKVFYVIKECCLNQAAPYLDRGDPQSEIINFLEGVDVATIQSRLYDLDAQCLYRILAQLIEKGLVIQINHLTHEFYIVSSLH